MYQNIALLWFRGPKHCIPVLFMRDIWLIKLSKKKVYSNQRCPVIDFTHCAIPLAERVHV